MSTVLPATLKDLVDSSDWQNRLKAIKKIRDDKLIDLNLFLLLEPNLSRITHGNLEKLIGKSVNRSSMQA